MIFLYLFFIVVAGLIGWNKGYPFRGWVLGILFSFIGVCIIALHNNAKS